MHSLTYQDHSEICFKFYEATTDAKSVTNLITDNLKLIVGQKCLFVGSMFHVAAELIKLGLDLTVVDYSKDMAELGAQILPGAKSFQQDLKHLTFCNEFDFIFVIGRVFTHLLTDDEITQALRSCRKALSHTGVMFFDNYEDKKIGQTNYFNGSVLGASKNFEIVRESTTKLISTTPYIVEWNARYKGQLDGKEFDFSDSIAHRAWSRLEIHELVAQSGLEIVMQGDNFDETSFFNIAKLPKE